ncbi:hypothetical protein [Rhodanobacter soli]|jgi:hypothetical protein|uniref:Uncharacterized protein n=1 Tax=Rhodanobacter soli TaxID=590609 RepID=A0ABV2PSW3_9GAMM
MIRLSTLLTRTAAAAMLGSLLVLAGCHRGSTKDEVSAAQAQGQFDTVIKAYKSGQFLVDGAVLSALDTGSHFAYLKDQGKLPKTVLLERSDDSKVRKQHLQYMARMQLDYGFTVYYDDDGTLKKINPVATKARRLEDYRAPVQMNDEQRGKSAADSTYGDPTQQQH